MAELRLTTSWDDGDRAVPRLAELLARHDLPATFYVPATNCEGRAVIGAADMRDLQARGFEIAAHGATHRRLQGLTFAEARREIADGRARLEDNLGGAVVGFAYPGGHPGRHGRAAVLDCGFAYARTTEMFRLSPGHDPFAMATTLQVAARGPLPALRNWLRRGSPARRLPLALAAALHPRDIEAALDATLRLAVGRGGLLHLWGHAWELDAQGLWPAVDRLFARLAREFPRSARLSNRQAQEIG